MKISYRWCAQFFDEPLPAADELARALTHGGLEVESQTPYAVCEGIVLGFVKTCEKHPQADRLNVCEVDVGDGALRNIICGAPNVAAGQFVAVAVEGAKLRMGDEVLTIGKRRMRGVESCGMICSAKELGIGDDHEGILVLDDKHYGTLGAPLESTLFFNDVVFEIGITPNRGDCLSHLGVAREIAAICGLPLTTPTVHNNKTNGSETFKVTRSAAVECPYYGCLLIRGIAPNLPAPMWMKTLLMRCGERPISAVVDITNYLMLAFGQPLHAFDAAKLPSGEVGVRFATAGESLAVLDGSTVDCAEDTLLITDGNNAVALGGVMGGSESGVHTHSTDILLEAAHFTPAVVRGKTRQFQLNSQAAFRFERGVDSHLPPVALSHAARWIHNLCGGEVHPLHEDGDMSPPQTVAVSLSQVNKVLGMSFSADEAAALLNRLSLTARVEKSTSGDDVLTCDVPSWRFDIHQPIDLVEEIIRMHGYNQLPETRPRGGKSQQPQPRHLFDEAPARAFMQGQDFYEIISYAFVAPQSEAELSAHSHAPLALANPMADNASVMRTTLLNGLLECALFNSRHRQPRIRLFEIGRCFLSDDDGKTLAQPNRLAAVMMGQASAPQWAQAARMVDFYDMKGVLESFFRHSDEFRFVAPSESTDSKVPPHPALHPHKAAQIFYGDVAMGWLGELNPVLSIAREFKTPVQLFEINLDAISDKTAARNTAAVSRLPLITRDLVVLTEPSCAAAQVLSCAKRAAAKTPAVPVVDVQLFDFYAKKEDNNAGADSSKVSYGLRFVIQGQADNLTKEDIDACMHAILTALENECAAQLRQ